MIEGWTGVPILLLIPAVEVAPFLGSREGGEWAEMAGKGKKEGLPAVWEDNNTGLPTWIPHRQRRSNKKTELRTEQRPYSSN